MNFSILLRKEKLGFSLLILLALWTVWLGQGRAQTPDVPVLRVAPFQSQPSGDDGGDFVPGVVLVRLTETAARSQNVAQRLGVEASALTRLDIPGQVGLYRLAVKNGEEEASAASLAARSDVLFAEPDYFFFATDTTPNDSLYDRYQWNLRHIRANSGWDRTTGNSGVIIAIADTGIDLGHPDLAGKIVGGFDAVNNDFDAQDDNGHGTHVASIAASQSNNARGIAGVDWNARLMPIKVLNGAGSGSSSQLANGLTWATDNGADVLNMSLASTNSSSVVRNAVQYAYERGVLLVAAAGNSYSEGNPTSYPAAYDHVIGVAAINDTDGHASYSNSGNYVDVAAPGGDPTSSSDNDNRHWIPGAYWRGSGFSYAWLSGTSQAAPHVAGLAGLLLALDGSFTPDQLTQLITGSAVDVQAAGWDQFSGYGRIDVAAALAAAPRSKADAQVNDILTDSQDLPALAIDSANNLTALWRDRRSGTDALYSARLAADALEWSGNLLITGTKQISDTDRIGFPKLSATVEGMAVAVWHTGPTNSNENNAFVSLRESAKTVWNAPVSLGESTAFTISRSNPTVALAGDGTQTAVWEESTAFTRAGPFSSLVWSQSDGNSGAWSEALPLASSSNSQHSAKIIGAGNTIYAIWVEAGRTGNYILTAQRSLPSTDWTPPTILARASDRSLAQPVIGADGDGNLLALWQEGSAPESGPTLYSAWKLAGGEWSKGQPVDGGGRGAGQFGPRLAKNSEEVALVWWDTRTDAGDIYIRWASWPGGEWLPEQRVNQDDSRTEQSSPDVAIDRWGNTTIVWSDARNPATAPDIYSRFMPAGDRFRLFLTYVAAP